MRLHPPCSDKHTALQCAEDHASQRHTHPPWRWWEKAKQSLSAVTGVLGSTGSANFGGCRHATAGPPLLHL